MGKSTYIQDFLKEWPMYKTPEKTYRDVIKEKGLVINEAGSEESQKIILDALVDQAIEYSKEDNVILDRCVLDNLAYTSWLNLNDKVSDKFLDESRLIVRETLKLYDILFFFPVSKFNNVPLEQDGLRSTDPQYREEIDMLFKAFQQSYLSGDGRVFPSSECPAFIELYGSREERIKLTSLYIDKDGKPYGDDQSLMSDIAMPPEKQIIVP
jgi:hypothetical protein